MRVLRVHNYYREPGGEDRSFESEVDLLRSNGHQVTSLTFHNKDVDVTGVSALRSAINTVWNSSAAERISRTIESESIELVHFDNTFPIVSPAGYYACHEKGVPVVQSLRNYRLVCANSFMFRDGSVCEDCMSRTIPWPSVVHACYRGSRTASLAVATMLTTHRALGTWQRKVDRYIALTEFVREKAIEIGIPSELIRVKPNFVFPDPGVGPGDGGYAIFVGRLSEEKGIRTLLSAWGQKKSKGLRLKIVGDGPLRDLIATTKNKDPLVEWCGHLSGQATLEYIGRAKYLVFPSEWYETFGRVAIEAFAKGTPVVASRIGAVAEVAGGTDAGLTFDAGSAEQLAFLLDAIEAEKNWPARRQAARREFEARYSAESNYQQLLSIYSEALKVRGDRST